MSRMIVTKLQVDVLVQAAVLGPMEAEAWEPLVADADALGRDLMSSGRRVSGDRNHDEYVFEPLPIAITAVEAIRACEYFRYNRSKVPAIVERIRSKMLDHIAGFREAPWGWSSDDIAARLDRPAPRSNEPASIPSQLRDVMDQLAAVGIGVRDAVPVVTQEVDWQVRGSGRFHGRIRAEFSGRGGHSNLGVLVARDEQAADQAFRYMISKSVWGRAYADVRRLGTTVIGAELPLRSESLPTSQLETVLDRLGVPDQHWAQDEPALISGPGIVMSARTEMSLTNPVIATTQPDLARVLDLLSDSELIDRLAEVDLREHSVLLAPGWRVEDVVAVEYVRAAGGTPARMHEELIIKAKPVEGSPPITGSVILTPRLKRLPAYVRVQRTNSITRFIGEWSNLASLRRKQPRKAE